MKTKLLAFVALGAAFCSCDPGATTTIYFENDTDHEVKYLAFGPQRDYPRSGVSLEELTIEPHSRVEVGIVTAIGECIIDDAPVHLMYCTDSIRIAFDNCCLMYYDDIAYLQRHSPYSPKYFHFENHESHLSYDKADAVYVITEEDYKRAW